MLGRAGTALAAAAAAAPSYTSMACHWRCGSGSGCTAVACRAGSSIRGRYDVTVSFCMSGAGSTPVCLLQQRPGHSVARGQGGSQQNQTQRAAGGRTACPSRHRCEAAVPSRHSRAGVLAGWTPQLRCTCAVLVRGTPEGRSGLSKRSCRARRSLLRDWLLAGTCGDSAVVLRSQLSRTNCLELPCLEAPADRVTWHFDSRHKTLPELMRNRLVAASALQSERDQESALDRACQLLGRVVFVTHAGWRWCTSTTERSQRIAYRLVSSHDQLTYSAKLRQMIGCDHFGPQELRK